MPTAQTLGFTLKLGRLTLGLSQRRLAELAGLRSRDRVYRIEAGLVVPAADELERIGRVIQTHRAKPPRGRRGGRGR